MHYGSAMKNYASKWNVSKEMNKPLKGETNLNFKSIYKEHMSRIFEDQQHSIEKTIAYVIKHEMQLPNEFALARRHLTEREKNELIIDIILPFQLIHEQNC